MSKSNAGKHGFPVLVYLTSEPLSLSCSLRIQHRESRKQVTLMLRTCISLHGADSEQAFVAQYDADNLYDTPNMAANTHIPSARLDRIVRNPRTTQIKTISLRLKEPCPLWCPQLDILLPQPEPSHVELFNELVQLAKATTVRIVFDNNWLSLEQRIPIQRIVDGELELAGFPVADYYSRYFKRRDWTVFAPAETSNKRARRASSPPSTPPPYKRQVVGLPQAPSPTEVATSPLLPHLSELQHEHDFQPQAISRVVQRQLPTVLVKLLPDILTDILPSILPGVLPQLIQALFALPASFTSSADSEASSSPSLRKEKEEALVAPTLTPLAAALLPHILTHLTPQLSKLHNTSIKKWSETAALNYEEAAEDHKSDLRLIVEDGVDELVRQSGYALDEVRQQGVQIGEAVGEQVSEEVERMGWEAVRKVRWEIDAVKAGLQTSVVLQRSGRRMGKGGCHGVGRRWRTVR